MYKLTISILLAAVFVWADANARQIGLTDVDGSPQPGQVYTGDTIAFDFTFFNAGPDDILGWRNGFRFWMVGGGARSVVVIDSALFYSQALAAGMDFDRFIRTTGPGDGSGADTIGIMTTAIHGGVPPGFNDVICCFSVVIDSTSVGDTLCIDSSWFPPQNGWVWVDESYQDVVPVWGGPHCFEVVYTCCQGIRGNVDSDPENRINIVDLAALVAYEFGGGPEPECMEEANVNGDTQGVIGIEDVTHLVAYLFGDGPPPEPCW